MRYRRYTLVSTQPDAGQRDLMAQIIDVTIPSSMNPSVKDAMQYVMSRSGYTRCASRAVVANILYARRYRQLQYKLGPMTLRNTLQVLSGLPGQVKVDEVAQQICFDAAPGLSTSPAPRQNRSSSCTKPAQLQRRGATISAEKVASPAESPVVVASVPTPAPITASLLQSQSLNPPLCSPSHRRMATPSSPSRGFGAIKPWLPP